MSTRLLNYLVNKSVGLFHFGQRNRGRLSSAWDYFEKYCIVARLSGEERAFFERDFRARLGNASIEPHNALTEALTALEKFQAEVAERKARELASRPALKVAFLDECEWERGWIDEQRLTILIIPKIDKGFGSVSIKERLLPPGPRINQLRIVSRISEFDLDKTYTSDDLWHPTISRGPHWAPNKVYLSESNDAVELGMQCYSRKTEISTNVPLNSAVFDFLKEKLDRLNLDASESDTLLLACGLPVPTGKIPRSRPIKWPQKIPDPVRLTVEPRRMSFEIARLRGPNRDAEGPQAVTLARWMAVEG